MKVHLVLLAVFSSTLLAADRPNVLVIMCDQLNASVLSCYGGDVPTPNIDRLAREGVRFDNAVCTTPFCSPSRASLITGQYPHTHGIVINVNRRDYPAYDSPPTQEGIKASDVTTEKLLHAAGYSTHQYGKWHLTDENLPYYTDMFGEHHEYAREMATTFADARKRDSETWMNWYDWALPTERSAPFRKAVESVKDRWQNQKHAEFIVKMGRLQLPLSQNFDVRVADKTIERIAALGNRPFMITCSFNAPHDPNVVPSPYYEMFDPAKIKLPANRNVIDKRFVKNWGRQIVADLGEPGLREFLRIYYASIKLIDDQVGRVLKALESSGQLDNTVIVFTADHGDMAGGHGMVWKNTTAFYDEIVRIPLLIRYPPAFKPQRCDLAADLTDIMPTLLGLTGQPIPSSVEGQSFLPYLDGRRDPSQARRYSFCERIIGNKENTRKLDPSPKASFAVRGQGWKYIRDVDGVEFLYHLATDPGETVNEANNPAHQSRKQEMIAALKAWQHQTTISPHAKLRGVELEDVKWTEGFWADKFDLCRRATLPSVEAALLDERNSEQLINLKIAAGLEKGEYRGTDWSDGDCYKWIEAMAYMYALTKDAELDRKMDYWIGVIAKAQAPDGYISTNIQLDPKKTRWEKVQHHALYNMGHLITAACAHKRATGKDSFLNVARKVADYLHTVFAPRPPELARMDFNPSQMMALVDLYRVTGNRKYLELTDVFITMRGSNPATPEQGHDKRHMGGTDQTQDRVPLRKEDQAVGHAVTGTYLWCGAADLYMETGEPALWTALDRIWQSAALRRTYITGGACALPNGKSTRGDNVHEAFGADYELPNRTAYNETCANIGNAMWNWRMLQITGDAKYADLMETVLYNSMLSAVSADGKNFCYANPLAWDGRNGWPTKHYTESRWFVHSCYCCPPQVARTIAGLGRWAYSVSSDAIWVHLYGGNKLQTKLIALTQQSNYPWDGHVKITITQAPPKPFALKLRIPAWATRATLKVNGKPVAAKPGTYATVQRKWSAGDVVELELPLEVRVVKAQPAVEDCRGRVAVVRGPVVYCHERPQDQSSISLPENVQLTPHQENGVTMLTDNKIKLIPYFTWANHGPSFMDVWIPLATAHDGNVKLTGDFENATLGTVKKIAPNEFHLNAFPDDKPHSPFLWFHFKVEGAAGREVTFHVNIAPFSCTNTAGNGTRLPVASNDGDNWTGIENKSWSDDGKVLTFKHRFQRSPAWVASFFPFTDAHIARLIGQFNASPHFKASVLGKTKQGRDMRLFTITDATVPEADKRVIMFTALQHDLETTGAMAVEGICRFLLSDEPRAAKLRRAFVFYVVPMMNPDGIAQGNMYCSVGNMNRQWGLGTTPETTNVERFVRGKKIDLFMDFHGWCTPERKTIFMTFGKEITDDATEQDAARLVATIKPKLTGQVAASIWRKRIATVTKITSDLNKLSCGWMRFEAGARLAYSIEIFGEGECTQQGYLDWGRAFAEGIAEFYGCSK